MPPSRTDAARDLTPGDFDSPPTQQEDDAIAFSPDGKTVAFVSNREGNDKEAWTTNNDVWLVPVEGGQARKLTANPAADTHPTFSADGRTLFTLSQRRAGFESDRWYLDAYDVANGSKRTLFPTQDISVGGFTLSKDGGTIWFTATQNARDALFTRAVGWRHANARPRGWWHFRGQCRRRFRRVLEVVSDRAARGISRVRLGGGA